MTDLATTFSALGDTTRLGIIEQLLAEGELSAGALHAAADVSAPAVSRHLKVLRNAGLIRQRVQGTHRFYAVAPEQMEVISAWTMSRRAFWTASIDRLETVLKAEE